jgi:fructoselysine and glucoselysine-specific PTS system IID component
MAGLPFHAVFLRSFFIQAFWNYPRMLGVGFLYAMMPLAKRLYPDRNQRIEFLKRHCGFFNSQPYCSSLALGYAMKQERDLAAAGLAATPETYAAFVRDKERLCGVLGLLGDQIFWQLLKPSAAALGISAALLLGGSGPLPALVGVSLLLLAYNPIHIWMRWWGLKAGYQAGSHLSAFLVAGPLPELRRRLTTIAFALSLVLIVVAFTFCRRELGNTDTATYVLALGLTILLVKRRTLIHVTLLAVSLLCLLPVLLGLK